MTVLTAIVELTKASWQVLRRHPSLIWFPVLSLLATVVVLVGVVPLLPTDDELPWPTMLGLLFVVHVVHVFFTVGLTSEALKALRGDAPVTIASGLTTACGHVPAIVSFAAVSSTIGLVLEVMGRSRHAAFRFARAVFGTGWSLVTYLAIPVMVQERRGGIPSLRRSGDLFRRTWGETTLSEVGMRVFAQYLFLVLIVIAVVLLRWRGDDSSFAILVIVGLTIAAIGLVGSLEAIYRAALYVFASEGVVPEPFAGAELDAIWRAKPVEPATEPTPEPDPDPGSADR